MSLHEKLLNACENGHLEVVKELLKDSRVDPSYENNEAIKWANGYVVKELRNNLSKKYLLEEMNFILDIEEQITCY